jgi:hypothetical protein
MGDRLKIKPPDLTDYSRFLPPRYVFSFSWHAAKIIFVPGVIRSNLKSQTGEEDLVGGAA